MIRVGGASEVEVKEKKDRVDDALNATRAAVEEGISPGGGVALLRAIPSLDNVKVDNPDQKTGVDIVRKAIQTPARQIVDNSGADGAVIVGKLLENSLYAYGYNAQAGEYGDLVSSALSTRRRLCARRCRTRPRSLASSSPPRRSSSSSRRKTRRLCRARRRNGRHGRHGFLKKSCSVVYIGRPRRNPRPFS